MENNIKICTNCHSKCLLNEYDNNRLGTPFKTCNRCRNNKKLWKQNNKEKVKIYKHKEYISHKINYQNYKKNHREMCRLQRTKSYHKNKGKEINIQKRKIRYQKYIKSTLDIIIKNKIRKYMNNDRKYNRYIDPMTYITVDWVKNALIKCNNQCELCHKPLKLTGYSFKDPNQFSVDRMFNAMAHLKMNCWILCWNCNMHKH